MSIQGGNIIASVTGGVFHTTEVAPPVEASGSLLTSPADIMYAWLLDDGSITDPVLGAAWPMFTGYMPDEYPDRCPQNATAIMDSTGSKDAKTMYGSMIVKYGLLILVRSTDYLTGWRKAEDIGILLDSIFNEQITNDIDTYEIQNASRDGPVVPLGRDKKRSSMFSINFLLTLKRI